MRFLHVSDTHLGRTNYKLKEREKDFYKAFKQSVDIALEEKVDFVIHTGDLFDKGNPTHRTIIRAIRQLTRLKNKDIPLFIIAGSHDISVDETVISILEEIGLVINLSNTKYYETKDKITVKGEIIKDSFVCGIAGRQANIQEIFKNLEIERNSSKYKIFMFHHTISDISTQFMDIPTSLLPKGFNYYAGGHWHSHYETRYDTGIISYAGSTEYSDATDMESGIRKRVLIINTETGEIKTRYLNTRKIIFQKINCEELTPEQATKECLSKIKPEPDALLIMKLEGRLKEGSKNMINRQLIRDTAKENGYLHCKTYLSDLLNPHEIRKKPRNMKTIEEEHLRNKGYSEKEIRLAKTIIEIMGKNLRGEELEKAKHEIINQIEK